MIRFHFAFIFASLLGLALFTSSCQDPCADTVCENDGICEDGTCQCPQGYMGVNCAEVDVFDMQYLLDQGLETPISLYEKGVDLNEIYGLIYEGGYLFFLDVNDEYPEFEGIVAGLTDVMNDGRYSGCYGENETEVEVGTGPANTQKIVDVCGTGTIDAASNALEWVSEGKDDWFVPSRNEMFLMKEALYSNGNKGQFNHYWYWSSSENPGDTFGEAFRVAMGDLTSTGAPEEQPIDKFFDAAVRAGRFF